MEASAKIEQEISSRTKEKFHVILSEKDGEYHLRSYIHITNSIADIIQQLRSSLEDAVNEKQKMSENLKQVQSELESAKTESQTRKEKFIEAMLTIRQVI